MSIHKNNTPPTKVVSLRLPIEMYDKYVAEAYNFDSDLSPHLVNRLTWYEFAVTEKDSLENTFCDLSKERDKYCEDQVKLTAEIKSLQQTISTLRKNSETVQQNLHIEKEKSLKKHGEFTQILGKKDEALASKDAEIARLKEEKTTTMDKMEETVNKIIDKAHDIYLDAPVFSKSSLSIFGKPLKEIYFEAFPKPDLTLTLGRFNLINHLSEELSKMRNRQKHNDHFI